MTPLSFDLAGRSLKAPARRAVFLDRDGTLIVDRHYIKDPAQVELVPHAADAVRRFNQAGIAVIVVSNQSGIARGLLTEAEYAAVRDRVDALLSAAGAFVAGHYHCPHHPDFTGPCACRKPGVELFEQAVAAHALDASASYFVGDKLRDVSPATAFGGRGILVPSTDTAAGDIDRARAAGFAVVATLREAADLMLGPSPAAEPLP